MSDWFGSSGEEPLFRQEAITEVFCELPFSKVPQQGALARPTASASLDERVHGDDLRTFPSLFTGEDVSSRRRRWLSLQAAATEVEDAFEGFGRDRDGDDFQRLWVNFLAPKSPQRLLTSHSTVAQPVDTRAVATATPLSITSLVIPTLLLSTNGASMADRLDLYGAFASYLCEQQGAYVALLRPEDLDAGVGSCFSSALAQFSGLPDAAAEDVLGLVAWYAHETGFGQHQAPGVICSNAGACQGEPGLAVTPVKGAPKTPGRGGAKAPGGRGGRGKTTGGRGSADPCAGALVSFDADGGTVAARLRARRGNQDQAAAAAAEAEARCAREAHEAQHTRNRQRHVILMVEAADRIADRCALRALLEALHGERHRLPIVLVLGLSSPAGLYMSRLPADMASLLQLMSAELAPHPRQLNRLFQEVLVAPQAPPLLLDGATMRELLVQSRLLEPSLACIRTALLEANEQHFRREPLAPLSLLPLQQRRADEAALAAAARRQATPSKVKRRSGDTGNVNDSSSDGEEPDNGEGSPAPYTSAKSSDDDEREDDVTDISDGPEGLAAVNAEWLERRRRRHIVRLQAAVSELPGELLLTACASLSGGMAKENVDGDSREDNVVSQRAKLVHEAVAEAFSALSSWRLGLRWLVILAERAGAVQMAGGHRYALPSLYVAAANPRFWKPPAAAVASAVAAASFAGHRAAAKGSTGGAPSAAGGLSGTSLGETLMAGVLGVTAGAGIGTAGNGRGTLRALPDEELDLLLDDLMDVAREALLRDWMPAVPVMRAAKELAELILSCSQDVAGKRDKNDVEGCNPQPGGGPEVAAKAIQDDETSPVRRRLAAQGLTSPPTAEKLQGLTERFGHLDPLPAPKCLQPKNSLQPKPSQPQRKTGGAAPSGPSSIKLPPSGQTQSKRQRDQALLAAVHQRAASGPSAAAAAAEAGGQPASLAAASLADRAAELLGAALRELLATCPFHLPGSAVFTFRDARVLHQRLVGAPALALHMAMTEPELFLKDLSPGLHPDQEDAAIAYQLLVGCREGIDLRDWLADFCAASGLGRMQEVQQEVGDEGEEEGDVENKEDGPMGRSRTSRRRQAPRKRKARVKQEVVLALEGSEAEAAVDALACRFQQVARELEAVGLCRFSKRRKGLYVHRTYFPPEAIA